MQLLAAFESVEFEETVELVRGIEINANVVVMSFIVCN